MEGTVQIGRAIDQHQGNSVSIHHGIPNNCGKDNEKRGVRSAAGYRIERKASGVADNGGMAVYTTPDPVELTALCRRLGLGAPRALQPVAAGVENSTWFLSLDAAGSSDTPAEWVLTIVEQGDVEALRFPAALCAQLQDAGLPVPAPRPAPDGTRVHRLAGKPALLAPKAAGRHVLNPGAAHCRAIGDFLGRMHGQPQPAAVPPRGNPFGRDWLERAADRLATCLEATDRALLAEQLAHYRRLEDAGELPRGSIHADLFRDNALFEGERLSAVIDFNSACIDWLLLDVAIALHDWAGRADGGFDAGRAAALLTAYARHRPVGAGERRAWPQVLGIAATRFWVSRALAELDPASELTGRARKDPAEFHARMLACRNATGIPALPETAG
jgi:homoserine kinase type II